MDLSISKLSIPASTDDTKRALTDQDAVDREEALVQSVDHDIFQNMGLYHVLWALLARVGLLVN